MGWTPLMIAASVKDSEKLVEFLLSKGADPNEKSESLLSSPPTPSSLPFSSPAPSPPISPGRQAQS